VPCSEQENQGDDDDDEDTAVLADEQLAVKTKSFSRSTMLGRNEQWCYSDYFQRDEERGGFTISKRALPPFESTPGRIVEENARVDQLHGLSASYLVSNIPNQKGLRVVFHAWFDLPEESEDQGRLGRYKGSRRRSNGSTSSRGHADTSKHKAQLRRLVAMAHGVTKLPEVVQRRRFGVQVPADLGAVQASNSRCPCCTHKLAPAKLFLKSNSRRCYLCGYLVCTDCWRPEHMECAAGRVAAIVVCTRCHANVQACEYAEVFAGTAAGREKHRGPPRVVEDRADTPTVSLLVDFLSASLSSATSGSPEHAAVMAVVRTLLRQSGEDSEGEYDSDDDVGPRFKVLGETDAVGKVSELLNDPERLPAVKACKLGNADQRNYPLDLPDDPIANVPRSPIPSNEDDRIASAKATGLLHLASRLAPEIPSTDSESGKPDTYDLELLCRLAVKTLGCAYSFVTIMGSKHEHVLAGTHPGFAGAAVPREQTTCQHALMSPYPFMVSHHEADVRFHKQGTTSQLPVRFYVGFPVKVPLVNGASGDPDMTVGMLCCVDSKPRAEITRTQYATMQRLASTAKCFLLQKSQQLQLQHTAASLPLTRA